MHDYGKLIKTFSNPKEEKEIFLKGLEALRAKHTLTQSEPIKTTETELKKKTYKPM